MMNYIIIELLYQHKSGLTKIELSKYSNINGKRLKIILNNLVQCDFVEKYSLYGKKTILVYKLIDFYTLFYLKFLVNNHEKDEQWWSHNLDNPSIRSWMGLSFEMVCIKHHNQIKKALGISGIGTAVSTWKCNANPENEIEGAQIDMIIERSDRVIHLCEIKFSEQEFNINNDYETRLRKRMGIFKFVTKTKKVVVHTFITTYGIGRGKHNSIVHSEVTMDDIFGY